MLHAPDGLQLRLREHDALHRHRLPGADHLLQLLAAAAGHLPAVVQDGDARADLFHLLHVVGGVDDGAAGTKDIIGEDALKYNYISDISKQVFESYGCQFIKTPIFEETDLFKRGIGEATDVVEKEMYTFKDRAETHQLHVDGIGIFGGADDAQTVAGEGFGVVF